MTRSKNLKAVLKRLEYRNSRKWEAETATSDVDQGEEEH